MSAGWTAEYWGAQMVVSWASKMVAYSAVLRVVQTVARLVVQSAVSWAVH